MKKIKVAHLTSIHLSVDTRIFYKECKTLAKAGYEVVFIVPHNCKEVVDGVTIRAVPKSNGRLKRMSWTVWQVCRAALQEKAQLYHFHDPELFPVGLLLKICGKRVIYDIHEDLPRQILSKSWIPKRLRRIMSKAAEIMEYFGERIFDGIVVANPTVTKRFHQKNTITVQNFPILDEFLRIKSIPYTERPPMIAYVGAITYVRGIRDMVNTMALLPEHLAVQLVLAGAFNSPEIIKEVQLLPGWEHIEYVGYLTRIEVADLLGRVRIGLIPLHPIPNYLSNYPVKLFEYMAAGIPVIISDIPLWRGIVEETGCGLIVEPQNPQAMAEAVQWLLEHPGEAMLMGRRGQEAVETRFNWNFEAEKLITFYKKILG